MYIVSFDRRNFIFCGVFYDTVINSDDVTKYDY